MDRERAHGGCSLERGRPSARARRSSPAVARDEDSDEAKPRGCSPKHGRRRRGSVILEENGVNVSSTLERRRARVSSKAMGGGAVCSGGALSLLYWPGRRWPCGNGRKWSVIYDQIIDGRGGLTRGIMRGNHGGGVKSLSWHLEARGRAVWGDRGRRGEAVVWQGSTGVR
jgi:hypothetical protein